MKANELVLASFSDITFNQHIRNSIETLSEVQMIFSIIYDDSLLMDMNSGFPVVFCVGGMTIGEPPACSDDEVVRDSASLLHSPRGLSPYYNSGVLSQEDRKAVRANKNYKEWHSVLSHHLPGKFKILLELSEVVIDFLSAVTIRDFIQAKVQSLGDKAVRVKRHQIGFDVIVAKVLSDINQFSVMRSLGVDSSEFQKCAICRFPPSR